MNERQVFEKLVALDPESPISHFTLGRWHYQAGNYQEAVTAIEASIARDGQYLIAYIMAGQCYEKLATAGFCKAAENLYQEGLRQSELKGQLAFAQQFRALIATLPDRS